MPLLAMTKTEALAALEVKGERGPKRNESAEFFAELVAFLADAASGTKIDLIENAPGKATAKSRKATYSTKVREYNEENNEALNVSIWVAQPTSEQIEATGIAVDSDGFACWLVVN